MRRFSILRTCTALLFTCMMLTGLEAVAFFGSDWAEQRLSTAAKAVKEGNYLAAFNLYADVIAKGNPTQSSTALNAIRQSDALQKAGDEALTIVAENVAGYEAEEKALKSLSERPEVVAVKTVRGLDDASIHAIVLERYKSARQRLYGDKERIAREKAAELEVKREKERIQLGEARTLAEANSRLICKSESQCRKAFAIAQIFINQHSDMKIQVSTDTIVETYNPTDPGKLGLRVIKLPLEKDTAEISIETICKQCSDLQDKLRELRVQSLFKPYVDQRLR
jgi:hypothetical protein